MTRRTRSTVLLLLVLCSGADAAQAQVLWRLDTSAAAAPLAGTTELKGMDEEGKVVDRSRVDGAGPSGQAIYRFQFRHDASQLSRAQAYGGEHYLGWFRDVGAAPTEGARFTRVLFRVIPGSSFRAVDSQDGGESQTIHKLVIVADTNPTRTILSLHGDAGSNTFQLQVGRNGGGELKVDGLKPGTWYAVQIETTFGSGQSLRVWVNNSKETAPTRSVSGLNFQPAGYDLFMLGYYMNRMIAAGSSYGVDTVAAEYGTSFDPAWSVDSVRTRAPGPR